MIFSLRPDKFYQMEMDGFFEEHIQAVYHQCLIILRTKRVNDTAPISHASVRVGMYYRMDVKMDDGSTSSYFPEMKPSWILRLPSYVDNVIWS